MELFKGKKGIIMGVANEFSIASGIAKLLAAEGATLAFSHLPDKEGRDRMEKRVIRAIQEVNPAIILPCDVTSDESIHQFFSRCKETLGEIDFFVHSIAYAPIEDIRCSTLEVSRQGFLTALDISVYSFIATARHASRFMKPGGSMITMSYFGAEKVVGGYNLMGVAKAALEASVRYLSYDLGPKKIRVNALSAGPIKTLAASAIGDFSDVLMLHRAVSPLGDNVTLQDVAKNASYLLSDLSANVTGEVLHVDGGYNIMGSPGHALERLKIERPH